jgi:hypothetical protein
MNLRDSHPRASSGTKRLQSQLAAQPNAARLGGHPTSSRGVSTTGFRMAMPALFTTTAGLVTHSWRRGSLRRGAALRWRQWLALIPSPKPIWTAPHPLPHPTINAAGVRNYRVYCCADGRGLCDVDREQAAAALGEARHRGEAASGGVDPSAAPRERRREVPSDTAR